MYSLFELSVVGADSSQQTEIAGQGSASIEQVLDQKCFSNKILVVPGAAQVQVDFSSSLTTGYRWAILSDYPIMFRVNGVAATQETMQSGSVAPTNTGAPAPYSCFAAATTQLTSLYVQPIAGAAQTANVKIIILGDPVSVYI